MIRNREHRVLLCGPDTKAIYALIVAAVGAQTTVSEADWDFDEGSRATLSSGGGGHRLSAFGPHPFWGSILNTYRRSDYVVEIDDKLPAEVGKGLVCVALVLTANAPNETELAFLQDTAIAFSKGEVRSVRRLLFVMNDALAQLELDLPPLIPWLDALDAWERVRAGEPVGESPMKRARNLDAWKMPADRIDRAWGNRLRGLANVARRQGIEVATLPVSVSGFDSRTGTIVAPKPARPGCIAFNLRPLVYALGPDVPLRLPDLFSAISP